LVAPLPAELLRSLCEKHLSAISLQLLVTIALRINFISKPLLRSIAKANSAIP